MLRLGRSTCEYLRDSSKISFDMVSTSFICISAAIARWGLDSSKIITVFGGFASTKLGFPARTSPLLIVALSKSASEPPDVSSGWPQPKGIISVKLSNFI